MDGTGTSITRAPDLILAHYHEIGLKGRNRSFFEKTMASNIRKTLEGTAYERVRLISGRILIELKAESDLAEISKRLVRVFGLSSFSPAFSVKPTLEDLSATAIEMAGPASFESFRVRARRGNSSFPETSQTVNEVVGQALKDATGKRVDLSNGEWTCHIELVENRAFMYSSRVEGAGGLPVGSSGRVMALLSGGIDSPVAAWQVAKRGADVDLIHFHGQPFADPSSARQAVRLAEALQPWLMSNRLWMVPFGEIQAEIVTAVPQELRIVIYRRFMMRIAERLATREGAQALVTGESLGQVASQTLRNLNATDQVVTSMPVLRPLIGHDKIEIEAIAKRIGTYEISIEPHQDCCVLFVPRKVTTGARPDALARAESELDIEGLIGQGLERAELPGVSTSRV